MAPQTRRSKQEADQAKAREIMASMPPRPGFPTSDSEVQHIVDGEVDMVAPDARETQQDASGVSQGHIRKSKSGLGAFRIIMILNLS